MRSLNVNEEIISKLYDFDKKQFNSERRFKRHQDVTKDVYFLITPYYDKKEINNIEDVLNSLESEALFNYFKTIDPIFLDIILL